MNSTIEHYEVLLGLTSPWEVSKVDLNTEQLRVDIYITHISRPHNYRFAVVQAVYGKNGMHIVFDTFNALNLLWPANK